MNSKFTIFAKYKILIFQLVLNQMIKILALGGSNSINSINRKLANFVATLFTGAIIVSYDLSKKEIPLFSVQLESEIAFPEEIMAFAKMIDEADLIVLSLAENNGSFNAGFKNLIDWTSRIPKRKIFNEKPMLLLSTSPGQRGASSVLEHAKDIFPFRGAKIQCIFSLPNFEQNFDDEKGITNPELLVEIKAIVSEIHLNQ